MNFHLNFKPKLLPVYQPSTCAYTIPLALCLTSAISACQYPSYPWRHSLKPFFFMKSFTLHNLKLHEFLNSSFPIGIEALSYIGFASEKYPYQYLYLLLLHFHVNDPNPDTPYLTLHPGNSILATDPDSFRIPIHPGFCNTEENLGYSPSAHCFFIPDLVLTLFGSYQGTCF